MTEDGLVKFQPLWTLAAVFTGFMLGECSRVLREKVRIWRLKRMIRKELESIRLQIPHKKDIVNQVIENLKAGRVLPASSVAAISIGYNGVIRELYEHLSPLQRNCLHVIHERMRLADDNLQSFKDDFFAAAEGIAFSDPRGDYMRYMGELNASYDVVVKLIDSYLAGSPIDVFWTRTSQ